MERVWVLVTSAGSGKDMHIGDAVYESRKAVLDDLRQIPNLAITEGPDVIRGHPMDDELRPGRWPGHWQPVRWAEARPMRVRRHFPRLRGR
jgi:hypothetical protein